MTAELTAGRGVLYAVGIPFSLSLTGGNESVAVQAPRERLGLSRASIRSLSGRAVDRTTPGFQLLSTYIGALFTDTDGTDESGREVYVHVAVDLLTAMLWRLASDADAPVNTASTRLVRLQRVVRENLSDRSWTPRCWPALDVSLRTVYAAFATIDVTPAHYIRRRRLELAAEQLRSSRGSISDLAIGAGFGDVTTFTRSFKRRYGVTPSRWRESAR
jgi:hypothetical protein